MELGNLVGKVPTQVLSGAVNLALPSTRDAVATVYVLADAVATFTYANDKNAVTLTSISLPAGTWLFGIGTFVQASGKSVCYIN